jgi:hypothetical protein
MRNALVDHNDFWKFVRTQKDATHKHRKSLNVIYLFLIYMLVLGLAIEAALSSLRSFNLSKIACTSYGCHESVKADSLKLYILPTFKQ